MKRLPLLIFISALTFWSCNNPKGKKNANESNNTLLQAINSEQSLFEDENRLLDILLDSSYLTADVLSNLISSKHSDGIVELICIVNSPLSDNLLEQIKKQRPQINIISLQKAKQIKKGLQYVILKDRVLFSDSITIKQEDKNCTGNCSSTISLNKSKFFDINWNDSTMQPYRKSCDSKKWICGTAKTIRLVAGTGSSVTYMVICEDSKKECISKVAKAHEGNPAN